MAAREDKRLPVEKDKEKMKQHRKPGFTIKIHCDSDMTIETAREIVETLRRIAQSIKKGWINKRKAAL